MQKITAGDKGFLVEIDIADKRLDKLIRNSVIKDGMSAERDPKSGKILRYYYYNICFLEKSTHEDKWQFLFSLPLFEEKFLHRSFYEVLHVNYKIKVASFELASVLGKEKYIEMEEIITPPDECRISGFDKETGEVEFVDYVERMDINNKKIKYSMGTFVLFKEPFYKNDNEEIIYKYPNIDDSIKYTQATRMNIKDIRYIGIVHDMTIKRTPKILQVKYKIKLKNLLEL